MTFPLRPVPPVKLLSILVFFLVPILPSVAQTRVSPLAWPAIERETRPWTRWWWMGSAVDSANISRELRELARAGFGGVEITAIYGVRGAESASVPYRSPHDSTPSRSGALVLP